MSDRSPPSEPLADRASATRPVPVVLVAPRRPWIFRLLVAALILSLMFNFGLMASYAEYMGASDGVMERYHSGDKISSDKIARLNVNFTISPPYTGRLLKTIKQVTEDEKVKGALLVINSPGGLVSDSHEIYYQLKQLAAKKPVFVVMKGIAASGGYYIAMGAGPGAPIYAEPTTWTGSIGVIMPRYDLTELAKKVGVQSDSLTTGPLKETLSPFKELTPEEKTVWMEILDESFERFLTVIDEGRENLDLEQIRKLATGQVYTADQALKNGLVDKIGYEEDALAALQKKLGLETARVVEYPQSKTLAEQLLGVSLKAPAVNADPLTRLLETGIPRAMYLCGWHAGLSVSSLPVE